VLKAYVLTGLLFMLVPGTFLGVLNLIDVSARESVGLVSPVWIQAHGHAQIFGWIGSFILGIGFYSLPRARMGAAIERSAWIAWTLWTTGVFTRWITNVYLWQWRVLLPLSGVLELVAFVLFLRLAMNHRGSGASGGFDLGVKVVLTGSLGFASTLVMNAALCTYLALRGSSPEFPHAIDQRFLVLAGWGTLAPFIWGFSLKWLPVLLGLRPSRPAFAHAALVANVTGTIVALAGFIATATVLFVVGSACFVIALGIFEAPIRAAKTRGVHRSFPAFVRVAYGWLLVAAVIGVAAAAWDHSGGIWGASRHAFTVGFVSVMVFCIGQRVLPEFAAWRPLWSPRLMAIGLFLLVAGCTLRVGSEILGYQHYADWAWYVLPWSAVIEMGAVTCFALNLGVTLGLTTEGSRLTAHG
jgi:hypothetical protein